MKFNRLIGIFCLCLALAWAYPAAAAEQLAPGIRYWTIERTNWQGGPVKGHVLEVDPKQPYTEIRPVLGNDILGQREVLSSMAGRTGAIAAINGGFFDTKTGMPDGSLIIDGKQVTTSNILRTSLGFNYAGGVQMGYFPGNMTGWENIRHLLSGGPLLVKDGLPVDQAVQEGLWGSVLKPAGRTAVGVTADGKVLLVEVDGRQKGYSEGLTLEELSYLMIDLGAVQAMALDGGGSSEMVVNGKIVNRPSDGKERAISNGLVVLQQLPVYIDNQRIFFDVPPLVEKGRTLVPMRRIFEVLGASVSWDENTKTVTGVKGSYTVQLTVGKSTAVVNGKTTKLDVPAQLINGRTLVPMRLVGEALGANVNYDTGQIPAIYITGGRR
ncbi:copper amine oxidase-like domain-containing protein [Desulfotomaculum nigrificans CO-1-SRB]|uniref:Copper amine oxidase-like domain-containing protein n=1 Tax=Desulfotomaculum nigrificans (strain DSM 14880 / VKM B-2319 / CO-1-SRB) TaxID=868595 RepID=F6B5H1_DESCC|nr:phosphodiester glycosidase family protein [Desulfotomaculum nigrificans]AEF95403.1 copper amine oxidase-like domain-containing protein [Desulfotomaculum nigrificans CO-1-SRB]